MGKPWTFGKQEIFLRGKKGAFCAAQKRGVAELTLFWGDVTLDFFTLWPTPEAERADAVKEEEEKAREEEEERKKQEEGSGKKKAKKKKKEGLGTTCH
jgi:uncharacterized membrane protein YukC